MARTEKCGNPDCTNEKPTRLYELGDQKLCMPCFGPAKKAQDAGSAEAPPAEGNAPDGRSNPRPGAQRFTDDDLRKAAKECKSTTEIAQRLKVSRRAIQERAARLELELPMTRARPGHGKKKAASRAKATPKPARQEMTAEEKSEYIRKHPPSDSSLASIQLQTVATARYEGVEMELKEQDDCPERLLLFIDAKPVLAMLPGAWATVAQMAVEIGKAK